MKRITNEAHSPHGFTLMELLVSVSIIAILIAIGIASYATINRQSRDTKRKSDMEQIRSALEMYRSQKGTYPPVGCVTTVCNYDDASALSTYLVSDYMVAIPSDPKNTGAYIYRYEGSNYSNGNYYGYCLSATLENTPTAANTCTPDTNQNYGVKNP